MAPDNVADTSPPHTYRGLTEAIASRYSSLSPQLQTIARFALEYPDDVALETVALLANRSKVQPSSMVRFAQALGYEGFSDMQQIFRSQLVGRKDSYRERIEELSRKSQGGVGDAVTVLSEFVDEGVTSLGGLRESVSATDLRKAVRVLACAEDIYVVAERRAFPVAFYLSYALGRLEQRAHLMDGVGGTLRHQAGLPRKTDVLVAISFPPYSALVAEAVAERHGADVPIVAITDSPVSPLALEADITFPIRHQGERPFRSLIAPMCLAQTLVVALGYHLTSSDE